MKQILLISALSLVATAVSAGDTSKTTDRFMQLDSDQNGVISQAEAANSQSLAPLFEKADANKDGMLDIDEFAKIEYRPVQEKGKQ